MAATMQMFTVRNASGQFLGTYRALTARQAISHLVRDQTATASVFRKSQPAVAFRELTASVEAAT